MKEKFYTILTNIGKAKIANSSALGSKVNFSKIKAGDGNGKYYEPTEDQIKLVNTVWEGNIRNIEVTKENPNWIEIETIIPSDEGGFTIREFGVFDEEGNLLAISKCPETYKPIICDGSIKELLIKMVLSVSNTDNVSLKIDPTIVVAKKSDVEKVSASVDEIKSQMKDIAKKTDKFTEDSNGKLLYNNNKVGATKAKELELETIPGMNAKDVQAGIAEVFQGANNFISYKQGIAGVVGSPVTGTQNKDEAVNSIQEIKDNAASELKAKNVDSSGNEALSSLVSKIAQISVQGMGGKRFVVGTADASTTNRMFYGVSESFEKLNSATKTYFIEIKSSFLINYVIGYRIDGKKLHVITWVRNKYNLYSMGEFGTYQNMSYNNLFYPDSNGDNPILTIGSNIISGTFQYIAFE